MGITDSEGLAAWPSKMGLSGFRLEGSGGSVVVWKFLF
jgi:hypothetical protein